MWSASVTFAAWAVLVLLASCSRSTAAPTADGSAEMPHPARSAARSTSVDASSPAGNVQVHTGDSSAPWLSRPEPARRRIVTVRTPLTPGGPTEVIELEEKPLGGELMVRRIHPDERVESATGSLPTATIDELWRLVETEKLQTATPPPSAPTEMTGAGYILLLEWPEASGRTRVHALHFEHPRKSPAGALFTRMAMLAREHAPSVRLGQFR